MKSLAMVLLVLAVLHSSVTAYQIGNYGAIGDSDKPSIFRPQEYSLEETNLLPNIPGGIEIPKIPGVPEIPKIPGVPEIPKIPGAPEIPKIPEIPQITDLIPTRVCLVVRCFPRWSKYQFCRCVKSRV